MKKEGLFIVLEGPDGCGTTCHSAALAERLRRAGHDVLLTAEPTNGPIGAEIRRYISNHLPLPPASLQLLFTADRALHCTETIEPALAAGKIVLCDRYVPSTLAYGEAMGVTQEWLQLLNKNFIQPDRTLYLLPPLSVCLQRMAGRSTKDALEGTPLQKCVHRVYRRLLQEDPHGYCLDTSGTKEEGQQLVWTALQALLLSRSSSSASRRPLVTR